MRRSMLGVSFVLLLIVTSARGADAPQATVVAGAPHESVHAGAAPHQRPVLPERSPLPGAMIILILGLFLAAAAVGPAVRYHAPEEAPDPASHDEHGHGSHDAHGHGHGHGH